MQFTTTKRFIESILTVSVARRKDEPGRVLSGVLVELTAGGDIIVAATDGKVMAEHRLKSFDYAEAGRQCIINLDRPTIAALKAMAKQDAGERKRWACGGDYSDPVTLLSTASCLVVKTGPWYYSCPTIRGDYPRYADCLNTAEGKPLVTTVNAEYLKLVGPILAAKGYNAGVEATRRGSGMLFHAMNSNTDGIQRRALIMEIHSHKPNEAQTIEQIKGKIEQIAEGELSARHCQDLAREILTTWTM